MMLPNLDTSFNRYILIFFSSLSDKICAILNLVVGNENLNVHWQRKAQKVDIQVKCWAPLKIENSKLSWLKTLHGYPNAIYENLGTSVHADLMVWGEINLLNKGGLKMNLAFLISFMTFHFYLNLAFHTNIFTIRIVIVIYFNLKKKYWLD